MYTRVIPRDLFNEAKLLKCMGQLALHAHDGLAPRLAVEHDGDPFDVCQDPDDGGLYLSNLTVSYKGRALALKTGLNSRAAYPLVWHDTPDDDAVFVFTDAGEFTPEFLAKLELVQDGPRW